MTRGDVLAGVGGLTADGQVRWMFELGYELTVAARGAYVVQQMDGDPVRLMGFNELQHQVYGRTRHRGRGEEWTLESFVDALIAKASLYGIGDDLGWAIKASLKDVTS